MGSPWLTIGDGVTFRLRHVACPDLRPLFEHIGPDLRVTGQVVCLSDSGDRKNHFAIIDVEGMYMPLIVPATRLRRARRGLAADALFDDGSAAGSEIHTCGLSDGEPNAGRRLNP